MLRENLREDTVGDLLSVGLDGDSDEYFVVNPSEATVSALVDVLEASPEPPTVRLFAAESALKELMDDFLVASAVADLMDDGTLAVRTLTSVPNNALLLSPESVVSLVDSGDGVAGLTTTADSFVASTYDHYDARWKRAPEFSLRTPPRSRVMETLKADIGADTAADFAGVLDSLESARGDGQGLDEVTISLLVAARNGELLYDISKWGEDVGLASKATFSRTKTRLEDTGLIETEKVPIDVGRPRLRLMPGDSRLQEATVEDIAGVAKEQLA
jgi:hypothetical protein